MGLIPIKTDKVSGKNIKFRLKKKGPCTVYATDIQPSIGTEFKLPIVILDEEQELELNATAGLGKGIEHLKYSPGLVYYKHNLDSDVLDFVSIGEAGKGNYDEQELNDKGLSEEEINKIKKVGSINEIIFEVESGGQMDPKDIFTKSIDILDKNLSELNKSIK